MSSRKASSETASFVSSTSLTSTKPAVVSSASNRSLNGLEQLSSELPAQLKVGSQHSIGVEPQSPVLHLLDLA